MTTRFLITSPYPPDVGYAIRSYVKTFVRVATVVCGGAESVHVAYTSFRRDAPQHVPSDLAHVLEFDSASPTRDSLSKIGRYVEEHRIEVVLGCDLPLFRPCYRALRSAGVHKIISYYGAPMGTVKSGWKLWLKRTQFRLRRQRPDHFIFESQAMRDTAVYGAGLPAAITSVVHLGVDTVKYCAGKQRFPLCPHPIRDPPRAEDSLLFRAHGGAEGSRCHREGGCRTCQSSRPHGLPFLVLRQSGRQGVQIRSALQADASRRPHVTFGGYRSDLHEVAPSCYVGAIASTGWDSFSYSSIKMQASGLPLVVSRFQGLVETIVEGETGLFFERGNCTDLADKLEYLLDNPDTRSRMSIEARKRVIEDFTVEQQVGRLIEVVRRVLEGNR